jgi:hypothetical protein
MKIPLRIQFFSLRQKLPKGQAGAVACACLRRELSGEPDAGNPHVRFDEGRGDFKSPSYSTGLRYKSCVVNVAFLSHDRREWSFSSRESILGRKVGMMEVLGNQLTVVSSQ